MFAVAAWTFVVLSAIVVMFQLAVAGGAPWGHLTQGGRQPGALRASGRVMAAVSAALLVVLSSIVLARGGLLGDGWQEPARPWAWLVVVFSALTVFANAASKSKWERALWIPVGLISLLASVVVAIGA